MILLVFFALAWLAPREGFAFEEMVLPVEVNTVRKGEFLVKISPDGEIFMRLEDFPSLGLDVEPRSREVDGERLVSLRSLEPEVTGQLDEKDLVVEIVAAPRLLGEHRLDLQSSITTVVPEVSSLFLNYDLLYSASDDDLPSGLGVVGELGVSIGRHLGLTTFSRRPENGEIVRLGSSIVSDDAARLRRVVVGDFTAFAGPLGSQTLVGGVNLAKNFSLDPYAVKYPTPRLAGSVETPSELEVYQNGLLVRRERLPPGQFSLENIPGVTNGLGEFDVRIRDAFGREQRLASLYYFSDSILRKGTHEYSYSLGWTRAGVGLESFGYDRPAFLAFHSLGLTDSVTAGFAAEASTGLVNGGPMLAMALGRLGDLSLAGALSGGDAQGLAGSVGHRFISRYFSTALSLQAFSQGYRNVALLSVRQQPRLEAGAAVSFNLFGLGSFTTGYAIGDRWAGEDLRQLSVSFSRGLTHHLNLFVTASNTSTRGSTVADGGNGTIQTAFAGLQFYFGPDFSGSISHSMRGDDHSDAIRFHRRAPGIEEGEGFGYEASLTRGSLGSDAGRAGGFGSVRYNAPFGVYSAEYRHEAGGALGNLSVAGSVVAIGRSLHLARPVSDGFALVRTSGLPGVDVSVENRKIGATDRRGEILVPGLLSYQLNRVSIDGRKVPVHYAVDTLAQEVVAPYRGGAVVDFRLQKTQAFFGTLSRRAGGARAPVEPGRLRIDLGEREIEVPVALGGEFYVENVPPGRHPARVRSSSGGCVFEMVVPQTEEFLVDLGEIACDAAS